MIDKKTKFLIVDDFPTMRRIVIKLLRGLGFNNYEEAENGKMAFARLIAKDFDFVITDWNMPIMSGIEFLKKVRGHDKTKDIPVLMITAEAKREQILEAIEYGVNGYVVKPFSGDTLHEKLLAIFERMEAR